MYCFNTAQVRSGLAPLGFGGKELSVQIAAHALARQVR